ncbi:MAG: hypothetical protein QNK23_11040 [Crocinitomicaceae bacterium]|nr:hypothetical protein [Crocinitomicaceae bacterium]
MRVEFDQLPTEAKVWMYQSNVPFTEGHLSIIQELSDVFLDQWESHGIPVQGSIDVLNTNCIRIGGYTNEDSMCGKARDGQARLAKELEGELNIELMNRMIMSFEVEGAPIIVHMHEVEEKIKAGQITNETPFYNNLIQSKKEFQESWKIQAANSWLDRYF